MELDAEGVTSWARATPVGQDLYSPVRATMSAQAQSRALKEAPQGEGIDLLALDRRVWAKAPTPRLYAADRRLVAVAPRPTVQSLYDTRGDLGRLGPSHAPSTFGDAIRQAGDDTHAMLHRAEPHARMRWEAHVDAQREQHSDLARAALSSRQRYEALLHHHDDDDDDNDGAAVGLRGAHPAGPAASRAHASSPPTPASRTLAAGQMTSPPTTTTTTTNSRSHRGMMRTGLSASGTLPPRRRPQPSPSHFHSRQADMGTAAAAATFPTDLGLTFATTAPEEEKPRASGRQGRGFPSSPRNFASAASSAGWGTAPTAAAVTSPSASSSSSSSPRHRAPLRGVVAAHARSGRATGSAAAPVPPVDLYRVAASHPEDLPSARGMAEVLSGVARAKFANHGTLAEEAGGARVPRQKGGPMPYLSHDAAGSHAASASASASAAVEGGHDDAGVSREARPGAGGLSRTSERLALGEIEGDGSRAARLRAQRLRQRIASGVGGLLDEQRLLADVIAVGGPGTAASTGPGPGQYYHPIDYVRPPPWRNPDAPTKATQRHGQVTATTLDQPMHTMPRKPAATTEGRIVRRVLAAPRARSHPARPLLDDNGLPVGIVLPALGDPHETD